MNQHGKTAMTGREGPSYDTKLISLNDILPSFLPSLSSLKARVTVGRQEACILTDRR